MKTIQNIIERQDINLKRSQLICLQTEMNDHIKWFFDIDGLTFPFKILKDLSSSYMEFAKIDPDNDFNYKQVVNRTNGTMELMSFLGVLHEMFQSISEVQKEINSIELATA